MELSSYLEGVRTDLARTTTLADEHTRTVADAVVTAAEPALRLALIEALTQQAAEISAALGDTAVEVHLDGRDPVTRVVRDTTKTPHQSPPAQEQEETDQGTSRITLRLPENVKSRADAAAQRDGISLNSWITNACRRALQPPASTTSTTRRVTGWA